jgi:cell division protease FtsH
MEKIGSIAQILIAGTLLVSAVVGLYHYLAWKNRSNALRRLLKRHFVPTPLEQLSTYSRVFPIRMRADLHRSVEELFRDRDVAHLLGLSADYQGFQTVDFSSLISGGMFGTRIGLPQYEEVDIGEEQPIRCLKTGLWLFSDRNIRYGALLASAINHGEITGVRLEIACPATAGTSGAEEIFKRIEKGISEARSYRGKILSLESGNEFSGRAVTVKVHRLRSVERDEVILPENVLALIDRNILRFAANRRQLAALGQRVQKGLLFYGPPGNGKTHTIHYLAKELQGHTFLLITAEMVGYLSEYMALARLLQPSVVVIEDVDLLARSRERRTSPCDESMLNSLLNEMDGLREDAEVFFILTTNRPQDIETALTARPGRIDQSIEFPLPDPGCRRKLAQLYSRSIELSEEQVNLIVSRTDKLSAAFIKELLRKATQFALERDGRDQPKISQDDIAQALDEILFTGGRLNLSLLGCGNQESSVLSESSKAVNLSEDGGRC